jgi:hypothetical protein
VLLNVALDLLSGRRKDDLDIEVRIAGEMRDIINSLCPLAKPC